MKKILVHGAMKYRCISCGNEKFVFLEKGLEDQVHDAKHPKEHKPVPFCISCDKCGFVMYDVSGILHIPSKNHYEELSKGEWYFANIKNKDCGIIKRL